MISERTLVATWGRAARSARLLAASALALAALAGCGGDDATEAPERESGNAAPVERSPSATAGRIGDSVVAEPDRPSVVTRGARLTGAEPELPAERAGGVASAEACPGGELSPQRGNLARVDSAVLCLLNGVRSDRGLPALRVNSRLARAALRHSRDMAERRYFAHDSPQGRDVVARVRATGYLRRANGWTVGENLAWGSGALATPRAILRGWMASPGHRRNILSDAYREIGIGIVADAPVRGVGVGATYTTDFGRAGGATAARRRR